MAVISCCDPSPVFKLTEHTFNEVSALVGFSVERIGRAPRCCGRNDRLDLPVFEPIAQAIGVVSFVRQQTLWPGAGRTQRNGHRDVGDVSRRQRKGDRSAAIIGHGMDFARSSAARTANRFRELPLFKPAAERWALT